MSRHLRIGLGSKARVGKDTAANYLSANYELPIIRLAAGVYDIAGLIQDYLGLSKVKDPTLLQTVGEGLRRVYGPDLWIDRLVTSLSGGAIVPDVRYKNEFYKLKEAGFIMIRINRHQRPIDRDPNHISEIDLDEVPFDYEINNDGTVDDLYRALDGIIAKL